MRLDNLTRERPLRRFGSKVWAARLRELGVTKAKHLELAPPEPPTTPAPSSELDQPSPTTTMAVRFPLAYDSYAACDAYTTYDVYDKYDVYDVPSKERDARRASLS